MSDEVRLEVLCCYCGIGGIAIGNQRVTAHKCTGQWSVQHAYVVSVDKVKQALDTAERIERPARLAKGGE